MYIALIVLLYVPKYNCLYLHVLIRRVKFPESPEENCNFTYETQIYRIELYYYQQTHNTILYIRTIASTIHKT